MASFTDDELYHAATARASMRLAPSVQLAERQGLELAVRVLPLRVGRRNPAA
jgi:hypothetical protein